MAFEKDTISLDEATDLKNLVEALNTLTTNINGQINIYKDSSTKSNEKEKLLSDLTKAYNKAIDKIKDKRTELTAGKAFLDPTDSSVRTLLSAKDNLDRAIKQFNLTPTKLDSKIGSIKESIQSGSPSIDRLKSAQSAFGRGQVPQKETTQPNETSSVEKDNDTKLSHFISNMESKQKMVMDVLNKPKATKAEMEKALSVHTEMATQLKEAEDFIKKNYKYLNPKGTVVQAGLGVYERFTGTKTKTNQYLKKIEEFPAVLESLRTTLNKKYNQIKNMTPSNRPPEPAARNTNRDGVRLPSPAESSGMKMPPPPVPQQPTKPPVPKRPGSGGKPGH